MGGKLSRREQTILNYKANGGNLLRAMIDAGYSESYANKNSQYLWGIIGEQIKEEQNAIKSDKIKSVAEIQERWSAWMDDEELTYNERIKCSELLAKSQGGFVEKKSEADIEEQQARIERIKAETARIKGEALDDEMQEDGFIDALRSEVENTWGD